MLMMEDRDLLDGFRAGDEAALYRVYLHYREAVGLLLRAGFGFNSAGARFRFQGFKSEFEVEDALQETFLKAFGEKARQRYSGLRPYAPYLHGITRNLVIDEFRRRKKEMALFIPEGMETRLVEESTDPSPMGDWTRMPKGPERLNIRREQQEMVRAFLESLDEPTRQLVQLRFVDGLSQEETADRLGLDRNRIRRSIKDLRQRLLRHMKREGQIKALDARELLALLTIVAAATPL
jgi:RNA polymerase sigma factor (sigma-70 family)